MSQRKVDLGFSVVLPGGQNYTLQGFLREFVFTQDWSQDEASDAALNRLSKILKEWEAVDPKEREQLPVYLEEKDFDILVERVKKVNPPGQVSIELSCLRNHLVLKSPKQEQA